MGEVLDISYDRLVDCIQHDYSEYLGLTTKNHKGANFHGDSIGIQHSLG